MSTFGLVIQGPLVSSGRKSGRTAHMGWRKIPEEDWVVYDCRENITRIVRDFGHLFEHIVVSTWKSEVRPGEAWEGAVLIASDDEQLPKKNRVDAQGRLVPDNRFRQMFSTLVGIEYLEKYPDVDMVVKIRTDQYIDLGRAIDFIKGAQLLNAYTSEIVFVPSIIREDPRYALLDYYFAGTLQAMKSFARSFFAYGGFEFNQSVHHEVWLKYAYVRYRDAIGVPEYAYFPSAYQKTYWEETFRIFEFLLRRVFWPMSFACFQTLVWRGEAFSKEALEFERRNNIFQEMVTDNSVADNIESLLWGGSCLLGVDWQRYARFRRAVGRDLVFQEQVFVYGSMVVVRAFLFGKRVWHFARHPTAFLAGAKRRFLRLTKR